MKNLREECHHPETGKAYIISLTAGTDISIEGLQVTNPDLLLVKQTFESTDFANWYEIYPYVQNGMEFAFVAVFASLEDRDYYVNGDKVHLGLVQNVGQYLEKVQVFDFIDGELAWCSYLSMFTVIPMYIWNLGSFIA